MTMLVPQDSDRKKLLAAFSRLGKEDRRTLLAFAQFLAARAPSGEEAKSTPSPAPFPTPIPMDPPPGETAVMALKRLKKSYPMIEADSTLLGEASGILMERVMGVPDAEVIRKMEALFRKKYELLRQANDQA